VSNQSNLISETTRFAYLQAMDVTCWLPKEMEQLNAIQTAVVKTASQSSKNQLADSQVVENQVVENQAAENQIVEDQIGEDQIGESQANNIGHSQSSDMTHPPTEQAKAKKHTDSIEPEIENLELKINQQQASNAIQNSPTNQYLKLVNWTNQNLKEQGAKQLLIICRHQVDQPANSFARSNAPSQFMSDYIQALNSFVSSQPFEIKIQLAHLSEAGLGKDSLPMEQVVQEIKPDVALILGDETIAQLSGNSDNVASLRGRLVELGSLPKAIVSYHPFSLIENPALKALALADLNNLAEYFCQT